MSNYSAHRNEIRIECEMYMLRICRSFDGKVINVHKHDRDFDSVLAKYDDRRVYAVHGEQVEEFKYGSGNGYSLKDAVAEVQEWHDKGHYGYKGEAA